MMSDEMQVGNEITTAGRTASGPHERDDERLGDGADGNGSLDAGQIGNGEAQEASSAFSTDELEQLTSDIVAALKTVYDPEIPVDIFELGLIYKVDIDDDRNVSIVMTLTAPGCPVAGDMPVWVENAVAALPGINSVDVELTFDPPWEPGRMSDEARVALNFF